MTAAIWMPEPAPQCGGNLPGTGSPVAGHVFNVASWFLQPATSILRHLQQGPKVRKGLGRAAAAGIVLLFLTRTAGSAQASASIQASVRVVDPAASAFPTATMQLSLNPRLSTRSPVRRDLRGATVLVEIPPRLPTAPARRVTVIHW
jgi:hypothetical protein